MRYHLMLIGVLLALSANHFAIAGTVGARDIAVPATERKAVLNAVAWYPAREAGVATLIGDTAPYADIGITCLMPISRLCRADVRS